MEMPKEGSRQKLEVDIFGKGKEKVSVESATTIGELRNVLNLDADIQAFDEQGRKLSDSDIAGNQSKVNFVQNVEGGC